MTDSLRSIGSVLFSVVLLLAGHGLQLTLLPLQAQSHGWSSHLIGITGSAYYLGFLSGCLLVPRIVARVGHIRAFLVFLALAALAINLAGLVPDFSAWLVLRATNGCAMAVIYTVVESWLNERSSDSHRGSVLATYMVISLGAMAGGQFFVEAEQLSFDLLFDIAFLLVIAAAFPLGLTSSAQPRIPSSSKAPFADKWRDAFEASRVGLVGAALSGVVIGLLWSVGAVNAMGSVGTTEAGGRFVFFAILGGLINQFPAGRCSDFLDRRWVIGALSVIGITGALVTTIPGVDTAARYNLGAFLMGAAAMPMYSICAAHANDNAAGGFLSIATCMLIASSLGSIAGPVLFFGVELILPGHGFAVIVTAAFALCLAWTLMRITRHSVERDHFEPYQPLPKTTPEAVTLDPRMSEEELTLRVEAFDFRAEHLDEPGRQQGSVFALERDR